MALVSQMSWWGVENCISEPAVTATQVWAIMSVATDDVVVVLLVSVWDNHDFSFSSFNAFVFCLFVFFFLASSLRPKSISYPRSLPKHSYFPCLRHPVVLHFLSTSKEP